jgi:predicted transcriptional regulator
MADDQQTTAPPFPLLTSHVVAAYVAKNHVQPTELPSLIATVNQALRQAAEGVREPTKPEPAVPINKSVRPDHIVCLFDGKKFKSLRRHLNTAHNLTPEQYRQTFGLRPDYPMVAPAYAKTRSEMAKAIGLGQKRRKSSTKAAAKSASTSKAKRSKKS